MPKLKNVPTGRSEIFTELQRHSYENRENNDCTVKTLAIIFGLSYDEALMRMYLNGRKPGKSVYGTISIYKKIAEQLGFKLTRIEPDYFLVRYPNPFSHGLKTITTLHPHKYNDVWRDGNTYTLNVSGHICAVVNGENHDWSRNRALRVTQIHRIDRL